MGEILKELNEAFVVLASISVSGDAVDAMAAAKAKLRKVYRELKELDKKENKEAGEK